MAKGPQAFRTISEAAAEVGVAQHVLRFWESRFAFVRPMKGAGGRRFYRPGDIAVLGAVRRLLHEQGYTIKGVQKLGRERGVAAIGAAAAAPAAARARLEADPAAAERLRAILTELEAVKGRLDALLGR